MPDQTVRELIAETIRHPGDEDLLNQVRQRAEEIRQLFASAGAEALLQDEEASPVSDDWLAEIYAALAGESSPATPDPSYEALVRAREHDEWEIGRAFRDLILSLCEDDPAAANKWFTGAPFRGVPEVDKSEQDCWRNTTSVKGAETAAEPFVRIGLTPVTILYAMNAVVPLLKRLQPKAWSANTVPFFVAGLGERTVPDDCVIVPADKLTREIHQSARCSVAAGQALGHWLVDVAQRAPRIFRGAVTEPVGKSVLLKPDVSSLWRGDRFALRCEPWQAPQFHRPPANYPNYGCHR